jgi:hypothetical protein
MELQLASQIIDLSDLEIDMVDGGYVAIARVFYAIGVVDAIVTAGEWAYEAGKWVGRN